MHLGRFGRCFFFLFLFNGAQKVVENECCSQTITITRVYVTNATKKSRIKSDCCAKRVNASNNTRNTTVLKAISKVDSDSISIVQSKIKISKKAIRRRETATTTRKIHQKQRVVPDDEEKKTTTTKFNPNMSKAMELCISFGNRRS